MGRLTLLLVCVAVLGPTACSASRRQGTVSIVGVSERIHESQERADRGRTERQNNRSEFRRDRENVPRPTNGRAQKAPGPHVQTRDTAGAASSERQPTATIGRADDVTAAEAAGGSPSPRPAPTSTAPYRASSADGARPGEDRTRQVLLASSVALLIILGLLLLTRRLT